MGELGEIQRFSYNHALNASEVLLMSITLETKKAYAAKTRKSNYAASLRLEGYKMNPADGDRDLPTREEILKAFTKIERNV